MKALLTQKKTVYKENDGGANMAQKGVSLIKAAFDTDNFLMRFSEKVLDIVTANLLLSSLVCPS